MQLRFAQIMLGLALLIWACAVGTPQGGAAADEIVACADLDGNADGVGCETTRR